MGEAQVTPVIVFHDLPFSTLVVQDKHSFCATISDFDDWLNKSKDGENFTYFIGYALAANWKGREIGHRVYLAYKARLIHPLQRRIYKSSEVLFEYIAYRGTTNNIRK